VLRASVSPPARLFLGVDEADYPGDFATFARYHAAPPEVPAPLEPEPLSRTELERFMAQNGARFAVRWLAGAQALQPSWAPTPLDA
jgi:hypothetical protein